MSGWAFFLPPERNDDLTTLSTTEASSRLDEVLDSLAESHEVVQIAGQRHSGVLVSEDDWRAIQENAVPYRYPWDEGVDCRGAKDAG